MIVFCSLHNCAFVLSFQSFAEPVQIAEINNTTTEKKITGSLMSVLFERKTMAGSSVTGKGKGPALDPEKVQLIICKLITDWQGNCPFALSHS